MLNLPTHPDGNFYSIPETNELLKNKLSITAQTLTSAEQNQVKSNLGLPAHVLPSMVEAKDNLDANTDFNNITTGGLYRYWGKYTHAWSTGNIYGMLLVFVAGTSAPVYQIAISATLTYLKLRTYINDAWGEWKDITISDNTNS